MKLACYRSLRIHRPQRPAAGAAGLGHVCRVPLDVRPRQLREATRPDQRAADEMRSHERRRRQRAVAADRQQAGCDVVSRGQRRSGRVGQAAALGSRIEHGRLRQHARAVPGRSRRLRVVRRGLRRTERRGDAGDAGVAEAAVRDLEARVRAVSAVLLRAPRQRVELCQRPLLWRLRAVRGAPQDHDEVAAGAGARRARSS